MGFFTSPSVAFGPGAIEQIAALEPRHLVLVVSPSVRGIDPVRRLEEFLARTVGGATTVAAAGGAPTTTAADALAAAFPGDVDAIVAVGGGSTLDLAKAARARRLRPDLSWNDFGPLADLGGASRLPFVAIPSTAGSGSEMTGATHLLREDGRNLEVLHRDLAPTWALLDPAFSRTVPTDAARRTGFEVVAHAIEALASDWANPFSDAMARDALAVALGALGRFARQAKDPEPRADLHYAAARAGLAGANSSYGLAHAVARALLPTTPSVGYAGWLAVALPESVDFNFASARDRYEAIAAALPPMPGASFGSLADRIRAFARTVGLPTDLGGLGVDPATLRREREAIVERIRASTASVGNPRVPSPGEQTHFLERLEEGGRRLPP